jgi:ABC-type transporter Mla MlaB component
LAVPDEVPTGEVGAPRPPSGTTTVEFVVDGPIIPADIPGLCSRVRALMDAGGNVGLVICDVRTVIQPDGVTIDALARLQLAARRRGCRVVLRHACAELQELLALAGLSDVVPLGPGSGHVTR